jgi:hypothetical protein
MPNEIDPKRAQIAMSLAVARWKKGPDDSIEQSLDDPGEWVTESAIMNHFIPLHLNGTGFTFMGVIPNEFSVGIKLVRQYAGLIYKHLVRVEAFTAGPSAIEISGHSTFQEAARSHDFSREVLRERGDQFFTSNSSLLGGK